MSTPIQTLAHVVAHPAFEALVREDELQRWTIEMWWDVDHGSNGGAVGTACHRAPTWETAASSAHTDTLSRRALLAGAELLDDERFGVVLGSVVNHPLFGALFADAAGDGDGTEYHLEASPPEAPLFVIRGASLRGVVEEAASQLANRDALAVAGSCMFAGLQGEPVVTTLS